jgi:pyridoxine 4-dehydrogenase
VHPPKVRIGDDFSVSRIGFGAMKLTGDQGWGDYPDRVHAISVLRAAVEAGIQFIDTADAYGPHTNEQLIKDALHPYPSDLVIATKGGYVRGGYDWATLEAIGNVNYLRQAAHLSARRLGVDSIDLYYLHSGDAAGAPFEDQIGALAELRAAGVIRNIGLSNVTLNQLRTAQTITSIAAVTARHNLTARADTDLLVALEEDGIAFSPWHPLTITDGPSAPRAAAVVPVIAESHGATTQQIALAWQLQNRQNSLPIPGTTSLGHLRDNVGAGSIALTSDQVASLDDVANHAG